jgi:ribose transport system substrate-binding protein
MSDEHERSSEEVPSRSVSRRKFLAGGAGALGALGAAQLGSAGAAFAYVNRAANTKQIAFAQPDTAFAGYPLLLKGVTDYAKSRGYEVLESHANSQLSAQVDEINTWIGQGIGGIIVLPLDNNAMLPLIKKAQSAGVKFLDYSDNALPGVDGWVIFNNLQGAKLVGTYVGHWINKTLGGKAKVALLTHEIQKTGRDRIHGGEKAMLSVAPHAKIVARHEGVLSAQVLPVAQSMLQAHPDLNVFMCIADDGCLGALSAFMQTHPSPARQKKMCIVGWDGTLPVFQKIAAGTPIRATGVLDLIKVGAASAQATIDAIEGKGPTKINFPYVVADQTPAGLKTAKAYIKKYEAIIGHH